MDEGVARRIVAAIKDQIHAGAHLAGERLPSTRAFAAEWGASRTTVTAAYGQLIAEGYLVSRPGARAVVADGLRTPPARMLSSAPAEAVRSLSTFAQRLLALPPHAADRPAQVADFRYGNIAASDFPVLAWGRAMNAAGLRRTSSLRYGDPQGSIALRIALQGYLWRARGISTTPDRIVIVNGSQQGLDLCARLLVEPGDAVVMENPGYVLARHAFLAAGGIAAPVSIDGEGIVTDHLPPARLAYVTPSHQYPLGAVLTASRRRALVAWAVHHGACIVEDDYDGEYRYGIAPVPPLQVLAPDSVVYVGTVSKTLSPALRLGYLVVPADLVRAFTEAKRLNDRHTPLAEQEALADLLSTGAYERHVRAVRRRNAERRGSLLAALTEEFGPAVSIMGADAGLHVVAWLTRMAAAQEAALAEAARAAGIGIYPVGPLYDPNLPRPDAAGFVFGYSALDAGALRLGVQHLGAIVAGSACSRTSAARQD